MELEELRRSWDALGSADPLWAVLSHPDKQGGRWDLEEFLATGVTEVNSVLAMVAALGVSLAWGRALDFGCGVGRLTQAMARHFEHVDGVDIAPSMIKEADRLNRHGRRCRYHVNDAPDLRLFRDGSFDFAYSRIVLQHVGPDLARAYLSELVRVTGPGGVLVFQLPSHPRPPGPAITMPDGAWRATLRPHVDRLTADAGGPVKVTVDVTNAGTVGWPGHGVRLGNHWLDGRGAVAVRNDGRADVPALGPGEQATVRLEATAPPLPGRQVIRLDLVQEGVDWFAERGSRPVDVVVDVSKARRRRKAPPRPPRMEMAGVPRRDVEGLLERLGCDVLDVSECDSAPEWFDYLYVARTS